MPERIQQIINQILDKWKSFSVRQKALIVSSTAVVITALAILGVVLSASKMVILKECDNTKEASSVKTSCSLRRIILRQVHMSGRIWTACLKGASPAQRRIRPSGISCGCRTTWPRSSGP